MNNKKFIITLLIFTTLMIITQLFTPLRTNNYLLLVVMTILISYFTYQIQEKIDTNVKENKTSFINLDVLKYIFSILIIILHFNPFLLNSEPLRIAFNNTLTRISVPFFFLTSSFFIARKEKKNPNYTHQYIKKMMPLYLKWSIIYIPILIITALTNLDFIQSYIQVLNLSNTQLIILLIILLPIILIIALVYSGTYYHLWYFPACFLSLLSLRFLRKHFKMSTILIGSFILLLFGATETYFGALPLTLQSLLQFYYNIFFTTRNFLFFGLFYTVLGYHLGQQEKINTNYCFYKLIASLFLFAIEIQFLLRIDRLDFNIILSGVPVVYYLFISSLYIKDLVSKNRAMKMRNYSKYYYLVHPAVIFFIAPVLSSYATSLGNSILLVFIVIFTTHIISKLIIIYEKHKT